MFQWRILANITKRPGRTSSWKAKLGNPGVMWLFTVATNNCRLLPFANMVVMIEPHNSFPDTFAGVFLMYSASWQPEAALATPIRQIHWKFQKLLKRICFYQDWLLLLQHFQRHPTSTTVGQSVHSGQGDHFLAHKKSTYFLAPKFKKSTFLGQPKICIKSGFCNEPKNCQYFPLCMNKFKPAASNKHWVPPLRGYCLHLHQFAWTHWQVWDHLQSQGVRYRSEEWHLQE